MYIEQIGQVDDNLNAIIMPFHEFTLVRNLYILVFKFYIIFRSASETPMVFIYQ